MGQEPDVERITLGKMQNPVRGFVHGSAAVLALIGTVVLVRSAPDTRSTIAALVFGLGAMSLYVVSTLYHSIPWRPEWKYRMQRLDHSTIIIFIAASYTPVAAIALEGPLRIGTLVVAWGIALAAVVMHVFFPRPNQRVSIIMMMVLGWLAVLIVWPFGAKAGLAAVALLGLGGIVYTIGMTFMVTGRPRLWPRVFSSHEVFHIMVVVASVVHWYVTYRYVLPLASS